MAEISDLAWEGYEVDAYIRCDCGFAGQVTCIRCDNIQCPSCGARYTMAPAALVPAPAKEKTSVAMKQGPVWRPNTCPDSRLPEKPPVP